MKLQQKLDAIKKGLEAQAPKEVLEIMHRATEDLKSSGILDQTVKTGDKAPDFTLNNIEARKVSLSRLLVKGPLVLGFYRDRW